MPWTTLKATAGLLLLLGSAPHGAGAADLTPVRFSLDWAYQGYHAPWVLAADRGFFAKQGLAVKTERGFGVTDTIAKLASGTYDIGFADVNALVKFNAEHPDNRIIAVFQVYDRSPAAIMSLKSAGIATPKDLPGKTLASAEADVGRLLFPALARANGVDPASVHFDLYSPALRDTMLVAKRAAGVTGYTITSIFNIVSAGVKQDDIVTLSYADYGVDVYGSALLTTERYAASHGDVIRAFIRAGIEGINATLKDRKAAVAEVLKHDPLLDAKVELDRLDMALDTLMLTPYVKAHGYGSVVAERMAKTIAVNAEAYQVATPPAPAQVYTTQFLPPDADRMVGKAE